MQESNRQACLVTGASGTLGLAICEKLLSLGVTVVALFHRNEQPLQALLERAREWPGRLIILACDLTNAQQTTRLMSICSDRGLVIHSVVCCAANLLRKSALFSSPSDSERLFSLNFESVTRLLRQFMRPMLQRRQGRVVLIGSRAGETGMPGQSLYASTKGALHAYARSLAFEVGEQGITVNVVAPGAIAGPLTHYSETEASEICRHIGLRRLGQPAEVAGVVAFLLGAEASYINGAVIAVDGGGRF
ncbi:SDR family NAD(P)-dependent oxidoreductase [Pseudomonas asplenii]|uniref:SDR family NAD(P)-dependent oxidoreductase n=1 Tax=Pseudomonas asplenii TaxID=53407 RepID=UPI0006B4E638|nr:SDR family NAD(P)-dependent oxidoreductase [Pseudomonas fuscovaginae]KPA95984.1 dehydrogenase of unknown specificity, short-chain alcohol dehydrogenase like [Pseudomonas fuscovaginae]